MPREPTTCCMARTSPGIILPQGTARRAVQRRSPVVVHGHARGAAMQAGGDDELSLDDRQPLQSGAAHPDDHVRCPSHEEGDARDFLDEHTHAGEDDPPEVRADRPE
jgi:hypothetical protein